MNLKTKIIDERLMSLDYLPAYSTEGAAGFDLRACIDEPLTINPGESHIIPAGFAMAVPDGYAAIAIPRSGLGAKHGIVLGNLIGLIDSDYRGHVCLTPWNRGGAAYTIQPMERIAQMVIVPVVQAGFDVVNELPDTVRGAGGFGSTGGN